MNNERLGEIRNNKFGTPMKIIRYGCYNDIDVEFLDENHYIKEHNTYSNFKTGVIKNPYDKTLFGVGYVGVGEHMTGFPKVGMTEEYHCWQNMLENGLLLQECREPLLQQDFNWWRSWRKMNQLML